jgi:hypothetical protein
MVRNKDDAPRGTLHEAALFAHVGTLGRCVRTGDTQRVLVPGTLKVYHMKGYGAIEMAVHHAVVAIQRRQLEADTCVELRPSLCESESLTIII